MKTKSLLTSLLFLLITMQIALAQGGLPGNIRPPGGNPLGWIGGSPGSLEIRNDFAGQPINFFTNGFQRMTILDGGIGGGFIGINTATPSERLTVRTGNINLSSPIGNTSYMLTSNAFPVDKVLWHNGERTNIFVGVGAALANGNSGGFRTTVVGFNAGNAALFADDGVFVGANAGLLNSGGDFNVFIGSDNNQIAAKSLEFQ